MNMQERVDEFETAGLCAKRMQRQTYTNINYLQLT